MTSTCAIEYDLARLAETEKRIESAEREHERLFDEFAALANEDPAIIADELEDSELLISALCLAPTSPDPGMRRWYDHCLAVAGARHVARELREGSRLLIPAL